jgi:sarcosine oxidase subunit gamma
MDAADGCYVVPRADSHAWFLVTGNEAAAMFAKICGVDLRPHRFADLAIAQTSVARLSAIVIRADVAGTPGYHLLADSASAEFLYDVLLDAMAEFGGGPVGLQALPAQR